MNAIEKLRPFCRGAQTPFGVRLAGEVWVAAVNGPTLVALRSDVLLKTHPKISAHWIGFTTQPDFDGRASLTSILRWTEGASAVHGVKPYPGRIFGALVDRSWVGSVALLGGDVQRVEVCELGMGHGVRFSSPGFRAFVMGLDGDAPNAPELMPATTLRLVPRYEAPAP